jgi:hypothetical protein
MRWRFQISCSTHFKAFRILLNQFMQVPRKYKKYRLPKDILEFSRISSLFIDVSFRDIYLLQLFFCSLYEEHSDLRVLQNNVLH